MPRLRHLAICVRDLDRAARVFGEVSDLTRVGREDIEIGSAIHMSDGIVDLALLNFKGSRGHDLGDEPEGAVGANHFGFQVEDLAETQARIEAAGGAFLVDLGEARKGDFEREFKDPDGVVFDVSEHGWLGADGRREPDRPGRPRRAWAGRAAAASGERRERPAAPARSGASSAAPVEWWAVLGSNQ